MAGKVNLKSKVCDKKSPAKGVCLDVKLALPIVGYIKAVKVDWLDVFL